MKEKPEGVSDNALKAFRIFCESPTPAEFFDSDESGESWMFHIWLDGWRTGVRAANPGP